MATRAQRRVQAHETLPAAGCLTCSMVAGVGIRQAQERLRRDGSLKDPRAAAPEPLAPPEPHSWFLEDRKKLVAGLATKGGFSGHASGDSSEPPSPPKVYAHISVTLISLTPLHAPAMTTSTSPTGEESPRRLQSLRLRRRHGNGRNNTIELCPSLLAVSDPT